MKIKLSRALFLKWKYLILNVMRFTLILFFTTTFGFSPLSGLSQNEQIYFDSDKTLTVDEVFDLIQENTSYHFIYRSDMFRDAPEVSVGEGEITVKELLNNSFTGLPVDFKINDRGNLVFSEIEEEDQQEKTVTGTVTDEGNMPLPGVNITVEGTDKGTSTDFDGKYEIKIEKGQELRFGSVGFEDQVVVVSGEEVINVELRQGNTLSEVLVVGYGEQKEKNITGAVSAVSSEEVNEIPTANVTQALQGKVPGLSVTNNGSPGEAPIVRIRGVSSINFSTDPLYIIDGLPTDDLEMIDTRDIESVNVLKDASAAAIYGSRATNGVVVITTKKGMASDKLKINYDATFGVQKVTKRLDLLDLEGFKEYALNYRGEQVERLTDSWIDEPIYEGASQTYGEMDTDWQDAYFKSGFMTNNNLSLSGGGEKSTFYTSVGYFDQKGTIPTAQFERYNFRINSEHKISDNITFGENLYLGSGNQDYIVNDDVTGARTNLVNAIRMMPFIPVYDPTTDGGYRGVNSSLDGGDPTNPIEDAELKYPADKTTTKILGTAYLDIDITDWLSFKSTFGLDYNNALDYRFEPIFDDGGNISGSSSSVAKITNDRYVSTVKLYTEQLNFEKTFGDHFISADAIFEMQTQKIKEEEIKGQQETNEIKSLHNAKNIDASTINEKNTLLSYLGRINYIYKDKYILNGAIRRDGLSVWAPGKKWSTFPSVSAGWRVGQEDFMKEQSLFSHLKLRGGYGLTGLNGVLLGNTPWLVSVHSNSALYPFNNNLNSGLASSIQSLGNENLEWETTKELNVGLDAGLLQNKLNVSLEYFNRKTDNLILDVPLASSMGFLDNQVKENVGGMENSGFEFEIGYKDYTGEFNWYVDANLSAVTNKVTHLSENISKIEAGENPDFGGYNITNTVVGEPIQSFYGWETLGIFQNEDEVNNSPEQASSTAPGDIQFADLDNNEKIDLEDRKFLGSFIPDFSYSVKLGADYKGLDFSAFFQGVQGNEIYNATKVVTQGMIRFFNAGTEVLDAWKPDNTETDIPRAVSSDPNENARTSDRFIEDGSYLRLKNATIGYTFSDDALKKFTRGNVSGLRVYLSGQNLFTITGYSGYDPEVGNRDPSSSLTNGIDYAVYPQPKAYQIGVQVGF